MIGPLKRLLVVLVLGVVPAGSVALAQRQALEPQTYMVPMRDGVRLATDVYLPEGDGPWPVILTRTPYGKNAGNAPGILRLGYARVVQDMRGRFESEGEDGPFFTDAHGELQDGYDTVEWLAAQPWCTGNIGMMGGSASGITQYMAASAAPPHLRCCQPRVAAPSLYHYAVTYGGVLRKAMVEGWLAGNEFRPENLELIRANPSYNDLWRTVNLLEVVEQVAVPMIHHGGWWDCFAGGTVAAYEALQEGGGEGARGNQLLIMGPWVHGSRPQGELEFPDNALRAPLDHQREFYARYLKGEEPDLDEAARVCYYVVGACGEEGARGNTWRVSDRWPPEAQETPVFLAADGSLSLAPGGEEAGLRFTYDPTDPVPTVGGANLNLPKGPMDQRRVEGRDDVLVFTSEPLGEPIEVTGHITAVLRVSSDCPDTDFTVKLTDVYPDGRSMLVVDGIRRARYRNGYEEPELLGPGEVVEVEVDLWSTSIVFNAGHRVRVAVSSSNYPRFSANPNTGAATDEGGETRVATNTVYVGGTDGSRVILPVVMGEGRESEAP